MSFHTKNFLFRNQQNCREYSVEECIFGYYSTAYSMPIQQFTSLRLAFNIFAINQTLFFSSKSKSEPSFLHSKSLHLTKHLINTPFFYKNNRTENRQNLRTKSGLKS